MTASLPTTTILRAKLASLRASAAVLDELTSRAAALAAKAERLRMSSARKRQEATNARAVVLAAGEALAGQQGDDPGAADLREAAASDRAAERLRDERCALAAKFREAEAGVTDAALAHFRAERDAAHFDAIKALGGLATALARMTAADHVRNRIAGERFTFDATRHPPAELWSGAHQARALLKAIPERFGGVGLSAQVEAEAARITAATLQSLEVPHE